MWKTAPHNSVGFMIMQEMNVSQIILSTYNYRKTQVCQLWSKFQPFWYLTEGTKLKLKLGKKYIRSIRRKQITSSQNIKNKTNKKQPFFSSFWALLWGTYNISLFQSPVPNPFPNAWNTIIMASVWRTSAHDSQQKPGAKQLFYGRMCTPRAVRIYNHAKMFTFTFHPKRSLRFQHQHWKW